MASRLPGCGTRLFEAPIGVSARLDTRDCFSGIGGDFLPYLVIMSPPPRGVRLSRRYKASCTKVYGESAGSGYLSSRVKAVLVSASTTVNGQTGDRPPSQPELLTVPPYTKKHGYTNEIDKL